jgi:hypothetical protein
MAKKAVASLQKGGGKEFTRLLLLLNLQKLARILSKKVWFTTISERRSCSSSKITISIFLF